VSPFYLYPGVTPHTSPQPAASTHYSWRPAVCERCGAEGDVMAGWHTDHALVCLEREVQRERGLY